MSKTITTDFYGNKYEAETSQLIPNVHVYGIAVRGEEVLISPQFNGYDWPGGTFELGEDTVTTLKREFWEETGYEVEPVELLALYTSFFHHPKQNKDYQAFLVFYAVKIVGGEISKAGFDADEKEYAKEAKWVSLDELKKMRLACSIDIADDLIGFAEKMMEK